MTTPPPSPVEHLQSTLRKYYNREVREWFNDVDLDDLDINVPRQSMALACKHRDEDSFIVTISRQVFFESLKNRFLGRLNGAGDDEVGTTRYRTKVRRKHRPQITLIFIEDWQDVEAGYTPVRGRLSFRLMDYDPSTITPQNILPFAQRIKATFALGNGFVWKKGKEMFSYSDWDKGYQLQLLCRNESEARRVIGSVLDIQNDMPDWTNFNICTNGQPSESYPIVPDRERIFGETRREPRARPIADVRFQYADLSVSGLANPVLLVDRSGVFTNPLVSL